MNEELESILQLSPPEGPVAKKWETFVFLGEPGWLEYVREATFAGTVGTGKTRAMLSALLMSAVRYPGARIALVRDTFANLERSTLESLFEMAAPLFDRKIATYKRSEGKIVFDLGEDVPKSQVFLFGLDNARTNKTLVGTEWFRVYVDQLERIKEEFYELLMSRVRQKVYREDGTLAHNHVKSTANMDDGRRNWLYRRFKVGARQIGQDILLKQAKRKIGDQELIGYRLLISVGWGENKSLNPQYGEILALAGSSVAGFLADEWEANYDLVFIEFDHDLHVTQDLPLDDIHLYDVYVGLDWGIEAPTVALIFLRHRFTGEVYLADEYVVPGNEARDSAISIGNLLRRFRNARDIFIYADPNLWDRTGTGKTIADIMYDEIQKVLGRRVFFDRAYIKGSRAAHLNEAAANPIKEALRDRKFAIYYACETAIDILSSISWHDVAQQRHPHKDVYDAMRYAFNNMPEQGEFEDDEEDESPVNATDIVWWGYS